MNQKKPTIKIDGVEINQTTPYIDYDTWVASPLTKALKDKLEAAVLAEQTAVLQTIEEFMGSEQERHPMFSDGYDHALSHIERFVKGRQT